MQCTKVMKIDTRQNHNNDKETECQVLHNIRRVY